MCVLSNNAPEQELIHLGTEAAKVDDMPSMEVEDSRAGSNCNNLFNLAVTHGNRWGFFIWQRDGTGA